MSSSIFFIWSCKFDNKLYKKYNSKWSKAHTDKVWHVKFYDYWRTTLTISRDYAHSELPQQTVFQIRHLFHGIALGVPNGTKLWRTDTGLSLFSLRGEVPLGAIGQFWKFWGLISHLHVRGTILCQFKNPLDMPSYLDLFVSRFSSWNT